MIEKGASELHPFGPFYQMKVLPNRGSHSKTSFTAPSGKQLFRFQIHLFLFQNRTGCTCHKWSASVRRHWMWKKNPSCLQTDNDGDYAAARRSVNIILNLLNAAMKCIIHVYLTVPITEYKWIQRASPLFIIKKSWINALLNALS